MKIYNDFDTEVVDDLDLGTHEIENQPNRYENICFGNIQNVINPNEYKIVLIDKEEWDNVDYENNGYTLEDIELFAKQPGFSLTYDWDELDVIEDYLDNVADQRVLWIDSGRISKTPQPIIYLLVNENDASEIQGSRAELEALGGEDE